MRCSALFVAGVTAIALIPGVVEADPVRPKQPEAVSPYMRVYGQTPPPIGAVQFCETSPSECLPGYINDQRFVATPARLSELDEVNRAVNKAIQPMTDMEHYGISEYWVIPRDGKGDCEDYALMKRHILMQQRGWPANALLMTVVRDELGDGHAVLTARTAQGDFILDNKVDEVKLWYLTPYEYVMRQSFLNPKVWMSLDPSANVSPPYIAGVKPGR